MPTRLQLTSETAPPPKNPSLQSCIEDVVLEINQERGDEIKAAIASM